MGMFDSDKTETTNQIGSDVAWSSDEDKMAFHYSEAKRLLAKAEECVSSSSTISNADTYITMARMHLHVWADLKSIATTDSLSPTFKRETVHSGSSYTP